MKWKRYLVLACIFSVSQMGFALDVFVRQQPLQQVLPQLAAQLGASVVIDPTIEGDISLSIRDATWEQSAFFRGATATACSAMAG